MKKLTIVCFSFIIISLMLVSNSFAKIDLDTAVAVWLFDEGKGDVAKDSSGNGNDGTITNATWVDGKFGKALEFNGQDAFVGTDKKLLDSLDAITIALWVKPGDIVANRVGLVGQNDAVEFGFIDPNTVQYWTPATSVNATYQFPKNEWHHIAAVSSSDTTAIYFDGKVAATSGPGQPETSSFNVNIGGGGVYDPTGNWFTGILDDVAIFHAALTDDDISQIMNDGLGVVLGIAPVDPLGKLATTWAKLKK